MREDGYYFAIYDGKPEVIEVWYNTNGVHYYRTGCNSAYSAQDFDRIGDKIELPKDQTINRDSVEKKIEEYLPLYIGQQCEVYSCGNQFFGTLTGFYLDRWSGQNEDRLPTAQLKLEHGTFYCYRMDEIRLVLRPLSSMTEEEKSHIEDIHGSVFGGAFKGHGKGFAMLALEAESTRYLLSKGFDLFKLIEAGLAIDATTIKA